MTTIAPVNPAVSTPKPLMLDMPAANAAAMLAITKTRQKLEVARRIKGIKDEARQLRREHEKLEREVQDLLDQAVKDEDTPGLPFDEAARAVADGMQAKAWENNLAVPKPPVSLPVIEQADPEQPAPAVPLADVKPKPRSTDSIFELVRIMTNEGEMEDLLHRTHIFPAAPDFNEQGCGRVGNFLANGTWWAVDGGGVSNKEITWNLHPLSSLDDWTEPVETWRQRWEKHEGRTAPENIPRAGVRVIDQDGREWVLGPDTGQLIVSIARQPGAKLPAAQPEPTSGRKEDDAEEAFNRQWYEKERAGKHKNAPRLTEARLSTLMQIPPDFPHLMLDPRLNDFGVCTDPERVPIDIPASVGTAEIRLYQDLDGKWWVSSSVKFRIPTLGRQGALPGIRPTSTKSSRFDTRAAAIIFEASDLHDHWHKRTKRPYRTTAAEAAALKSFIKAVAALAGGSGSSGAVLAAPKPATGKLEGVRYIGTDRPEEKAKAKHLKQVSLGSFCGGLKTALKKNDWELAGRIGYDAKTKTAAPEVVACWEQGYSVAMAAAHLREVWRSGE